MTSFVFLVLACVLMGALAEPPVDRRYLPPSPSEVEDLSKLQVAAPSIQYGPPSRITAQQSAQYKAPSHTQNLKSSQKSHSLPVHKPVVTSGQLSVPSTVKSSLGYQRTVPVISNQYGPPATSLRVAAAPANLYGPPSQSQRLNSAPINKHVALPSPQYGPPSLSQRLNSAPINKHVALPSPQYGPPSLSQRLNSAPINKHVALPSPQYGPPSLSQRLNSAPVNKHVGLPSPQYGPPALHAPSTAKAQNLQVPSVSHHHNEATSSLLSSVPSSHYGSPAVSSQYNTKHFQSLTAAPEVHHAAPYEASRLSAAGQSPSARLEILEEVGSEHEDGQSEPANYEFAYEVQAYEYGSEFGHRESRHGEDAQGEYHVVLPDGRRQIVEYQAGLDGYKPVIRYEESGLGARSENLNLQGPY